MKISAAILIASVGSAAAFVAPQAKSSIRTTLAMSSGDDETIPQIQNEMVAAEEEIIAKNTLPGMSTALPFMERPAALDGTLAGDVGFDPLGFAKDKDTLMQMREAEIKHARLAMLAAAGWPISELADKKLALVAGLDPLLQSADRAPSVLNGGLGKVSPIYWGVCIAAAAAIDLYGIFGASKKAGYIPGDFGFDPLGLYPKDAEGQKRMQLSEIKNGRLAMIAITAFAVQEFVSQTGVVDETPIFFKPIGQVMFEYANSGYIH
ncbi:chlorophyll A-B binding protein [Nitzschia inconspicua]|uniref:Chlorophyll A-B binding protein n=1 Tax=Nitzschia inconspicua TaxID=303405 RepID=A0A9K3PZJ6_9STRA|nr:chlorophyll A-B binding protein [Nitzschia inconspicua]